MTQRRQDPHDVFCPLCLESMEVREALGPSALFWCTNESCGVQGVTIVMANPNLLSMIWAHYRLAGYLVDFPQKMLGGQARIGAIDASLYREAKAIARTVEEMEEKMREGLAKSDAGEV